MSELIEVAIPIATFISTIIVIAWAIRSMENMEQRREMRRK